jgi:hypothetical protein
LFPAPFQEEQELGIFLPFHLSFQVPGLGEGAKLQCPDYIQSLSETAGRIALAVAVLLESALKVSRRADVMTTG